MSSLFSVDTKTLQKVSDFFHLGVLTSSKKIPQGMSNPSYLVRNTEEKEFVIRILKKQTLEGLKNEYFIQQQLERRDITCPIMLLGNHGSYYYKSASIIATVSKKIEGFHPGYINQLVCNRLGEMLARFHEAITYTKLPTSHKGWLNIESAKNNLVYLPKNDNYKKIISVIKSTEDLFSKNLPSGVIHGDLIIENILFDSEDTIAAILDFDESEENIFLLDLAKTISGVCISNGQIDKNLMRSFLLGYNKVRLVTREEKLNLTAALLYVFGVCAVWFMKNGYNESARRYLNFRLPL